MKLAALGHLSQYQSSRDRIKRRWLQLVALVDSLPPRVLERLLFVILAVAFALLGSSCANSTEDGPVSTANPYRGLLSGTQGPSEPVLLHPTDSSTSAASQSKTPPAAAGTAGSSGR